MRSERCGVGGDERRSEHVCLDGFGRGTLDALDALRR